MNYNINNRSPGREGGYRGNNLQRPPSAGGNNKQYGYPPRGQGNGGSPTRNARPDRNRGMSQGSPAGRRSASPKGYSTGGGGYDGFRLLFILLIVAVVITGIIVAVLKSRDSSPVSAKDSETDSVITPTETYRNEPIETDPPKVNVHYAIEDENTLHLMSQVQSQYAIMIDPEEGRIVAEKNSDSMIYPASMTKIMTLIVAYENCRDLDDTFVLTNEITDPLFVAGASTAGFEVGQPITVRDMLYGAALPSGADATDGLAYYVAGSIQGFVDMMNEKALSMGLSNTHFMNPSGLHDDDHYSTPHEIALILEYAISIPYLREIMSSRTYAAQATNQMNPSGITMYNTMFSRLGALADSKDAVIIAGKTGYTNEGLNCLASVGRSKANGKEYIVVAAKAPGKNDAATDTVNLFSLMFGSNS